MVLRKPYAFLIKNFRIIHIIFALILLFVRRNFGKVVTFFSQYAGQTFSSYSSIVLIRIDLILYLAVIVVISFAIMMLVLMKRKEKPIVLYISVLVYYIIILILMFVASNIISSLTRAALSHRNARLVRDLYFLLSLPQYFFIIFAFVRGVGFDVKKFNFSKDLEELEISSEDSEEFEFVVGTDSYKYKRKIRRYLREIKYYYLENKIIINIILLVVVLPLSIYGAINIGIFDKTYKAGSTGRIGAFTYKIKGTYETEFDYNGKQIKEDKKYVVINIEITNNSDQDRIFDPTMIYLSKGNYNFYNHPSIRNSFIDIGKGYVNEEIKRGQSRDIAFIYEMDKRKIFGNYYLRIFKEMSFDKGYWDFNYSKFKVAPIKLERNENPSSRQLKEIIRLDKNVYDDTNITFNNIEIKQSYEYEYESCNQNGCKTYVDVVRTNNPSTHDLLIINYELNIKEGTAFEKAMQDDRYFFDNLLFIEYKLNNRIHLDSLKTKINLNLENMIFAEVPKMIKTSDVFNLVLNTRLEKNIIDLNKLKEA